MNKAAAPFWLRACAWLAVVLASLGVLLLYTRPDFLVMVADQLWACF